jgi:uncharacterized protein YbgA (DUF1722 family)
MVTEETNCDKTEGMRRWAERRLRDLEDEGLCGFIFKSHSPSCGISGVKLFGYNGAPPRRCGIGVFARAAQNRFPLLPAADETGMRDPATREAFIDGLFAAMRWRDFMGNGPTLNGLLEFHSAHELLIFSHDPKTAADIERLMRGAARMNRLKLFSRYGDALMRALAVAASPVKNTRALKEAFQRLKKKVPKPGADHIVSVIEEYREGHIPLLVPLALLRHYVERAQDQGLKRQFFLNPYPTELGLRAR